MHGDRMGARFQGPGAWRRQGGKGLGYRRRIVEHLGDLQTFAGLFNESGEGKPLAMHVESKV